MNSQSLPAPSSPMLGRKRRMDSDSQPQTPVRRRKVSTTRVKQLLKRQGAGNSLIKTQDGNTQQKSPGTILLSSPTDVSDASVVQVRAKQAKASGLPNLSLLSPPEIVTKVDQQQEEVSEVEDEDEAQALTPRPSLPMRRRSPPRPPLSRRRAVTVNRARFGVGIVRCRSWGLNNGEETEMEDESPPSSPPSRVHTSIFPVSAMQPSSCKCSDEMEEESETLEEIVGNSVLPIDPSQTCFDPSYGEDRWQIRSPSSDEEFVPENSCCAGKNGEKGGE